MLTALALLALASPHRIEICGPLLHPSHVQLRILPRTAPSFSPLVHSPDALDEPRARPRSFAAIDGSPALQNEGPPERAFRFHRRSRR